jgi:hypothetical protein
MPRRYEEYVSDTEPRAVLTGLFARRRGGTHGPDRRGRPFERTNGACHTQSYFKGEPPSRHLSETTQGEATATAIAAPA